MTIEQILQRIKSKHPMASINESDIRKFILIREAIRDLENEEQEALHNSIMNDIHDHYGDS